MWRLAGGTLALAATIAKLASLPSNLLSTCFGKASMMIPAQAMRSMSPEMKSAAVVKRGLVQFGQYANDHIHLSI